MQTNTILASILFASLLFGIAHVAYYHPQLPDTVASHFNARGEADGTSSKTAHTALMISLQTGMVLMFLTIGFVAKVLPPSLVNLPNRDYWLAPERKEQTIRKMTSGLLVMGIGTQIFFVVLNHIITLYNLGVPALNWFWLVFTVYMLFVVGFCIWMVMKFRLPASEKDVPKTEIGAG